MLMSGLSVCAQIGQAEQAPAKPAAKQYISPGMRLSSPPVVEGFAVRCAGPRYAGRRGNGQAGEESIAPRRIASVSSVSDNCRCQPRRRRNSTPSCRQSSTGRAKGSCDNRGQGAGFRVPRAKSPIVDVFVAGGGPSGVAAAVAASRQGARVFLAEATSAPVAWARRVCCLQDYLRGVPTNR